MHSFKINYVLWGEVLYLLLLGVVSRCSVSLRICLKSKKNKKKQQKVLYVLYKCVHLRTHNKLIHTLIKVFRFKVMQVLREKGLHFLLYGR